MSKTWSEQLDSIDKGKSPGQAAAKPVTRAAVDAARAVCESLSVAVLRGGGIGIELGVKGGARFELLVSPDGTVKMSSANFV